LLEKKLIYDSAMRLGSVTAHAITDLKAYYDRQHPNLYGIVEESVGVNYQAIKLIMKVILRMEYHIYTGYGISSEWYGREKNQIGEIE